MFLSSTINPATSRTMGLTLTFEAERSAGLVIEYVGRRRLRLTHRGKPVLWAWVELGHQGVWVVRADAAHTLAVLPPITARVARETRGADAWMKHFARALDASDGAPIKGGAWRLTGFRRGMEGRAGGANRAPIVPVDPDERPAVGYGATRALSLPRVHRESWMTNGSGAVFALRETSPPESARVKSWRKHAREGSLPPVLVWWVSALDMYLVLDGHDRLQAAALEDIEPSVIALWRPTSEPLEAPLAPWRAQAVADYERAFVNEPQLSLRSREQLNRSLVFASRGWQGASSRAVARPELATRWCAEVQTQLAAFYS